MSPAIIAALITQLGVPEVMRWLAERQAAGQTVVTEADALVKLGVDVDAGNEMGRAFLAAHPAE